MAFFFSPPIAVGFLKHLKFFNISRARMLDFLQFFSAFFNKTKRKNIKEETEALPLSKFTETCNFFSLPMSPIII